MEKEKEKEQIDIVNPVLDLQKEEAALGVEYEVVIGEKKKD